MSETPKSERTLSRGSLIAILSLAIGCLAGVAVGVVIGFSADMEQSLISKTCRVLPKVDLAVPEIVKLKDRWKAYTRDASPQAALDLSPEEVTFLLQAESEIGVDLSARSDQLSARLTVPVENGCYNVDFNGGLQVQNGLAVVSTERLEVGGQDLSGLMSIGGAIGGTRQALTADDLEDPRLSRMLRNVETLTVEGGRIRVRFTDPDQVWK